MRFLPVQYPTEEEKANPAEFANTTRNTLAKAANCSVSEHSYPDLFLATEARKVQSGVLFSWVSCLVG